MATLDRLDHQLLHALGVSGRAPFRQLATVLGTTEHTLARRYRALMESGVVRVVAAAAPSPDEIGQLLRLHVHPGSTTRIAEALARRDDVSWVRTAGSGAEISCGVRAETTHQRDHLILEQLPRTGRVTSVTTQEVLHHYRTPGHADWAGFPHPLSAAQHAQLVPSPPAEVTAERLTGQDRAILGALADDARRGATAIAASTGLPASTVRRRLAALLDSGAIRLDIDIDRGALGYPVTANLYLDIAPRQLHAAGSDLTRHRQTVFVAAVTGPTNLFAVVATRGVAELYRYVTTTLAQTRGVRHIETSTTNPYLKGARTIRTHRPDSG